MTAARIAAPRSISTRCRSKACRSSRRAPAPARRRTITGLFLRLVIETGVPIEQILVVTYTVAATEELRERIWSLLTAALAALRGETCPDELAAELTAVGSSRSRRGGAPRGARAHRLRPGGDPHDPRLLSAGAGRARLRDRAALRRRSSWPTSSDLLQEVVDDFWRRRVTGESWLLVQHLLDQRVSPDGLARAVSPYLGLPDLPSRPSAGDRRRRDQCRVAHCLAHAAGDVARRPRRRRGAAARPGDQEEHLQARRRRTPPPSHRCRPACRAAGAAHDRGALPAPRSGPRRRRLEAGGGAAQPSGARPRWCAGCRGRDRGVPRSKRACAP